MLALFDGVRLTPTQRRLAQCLLERGARAAYLSSGELAELAGVSQPSVTRFAMALGYDGYPALRRALQTLDGTGPGPDSPENEVQHAVRGEAEILTRLADRLADTGADRAALTEAGKMLTGSRPLPVLGLRSAAPLAGYFGYFAAKIHPDVRVLDQGGSLLTDRLEQARAAGGTAMLGVVLPRHPKKAPAALRAAPAPRPSPVPRPG